MGEGLSKNGYWVGCVLVTISRGQVSYDTNLNWATRIGVQGESFAWRSQIDLLASEQTIWGLVGRGLGLQGVRGT